MRLLYRFLTLARSERRLLVHAALLLLVIHLTKGRVPFRTMRRLLVRRPHPRKGPASVGPRPINVDEIVWAVKTVSRGAERWTSCLSQAVAVQALLAGQGHASRLHVGVLRGDHGEVEGHAWVELDGRVVIGGSMADVARFSPLTVFDTDDPGPSTAEDRGWPVVGALQGGR
jgi:hypothetical protein